MDLLTLLRETADLRQRTADLVLSGRVNNYEEYKFNMGKLRAYDDVLDLPKPKEKEREDESS